MEVASPNHHFAALKSPCPEADNCNTQVAAQRQGKPNAYRKHTILCLQVFVGLCILLYTIGHFIYWTPLFQLRLKALIGIWWDVPHQYIGYFLAKNAPGHQEMIRPTFFVLFCFMPTLLSVIVIEAMGRVTLRRMSSQCLLDVGIYLRRHPTISLGSVKWPCPISNGELLFVACMVFGNLWAFSYAYIRSRLYQHTLAEPLSKGQYLEALSVGFGYVCIFNLAFLFIPATRNHSWLTFFNISYANGVRYHRWIGTVAIVAGTIHGSIYCVAWIVEKKFLKNITPCFDCPLGGATGTAIWTNMFGMITLLMFLAIGVTSIPYIRRQNFELFYYTHHLFVVAMITMIMHFAGSIWWILPTMMLYLTRRAISTLNGHSAVTITNLTLFGDPQSPIIELVIARSKGDDGSFEIGNYVYVNVPSISKLQWHPFTIASSQTSQIQSFTIFVKPLGTWTQQFCEYLTEIKKNQTIPIIHIDGFHGGSLHSMTNVPVICLVAGGIGVTPLLAILEDIACEVSAAGTWKTDVYLIYSFREAEMLHAMHPLLMRILQMDPQQQHFHTYFYYTNPTEEHLNRSLIRHAYNTIRVPASKESDFVDFSDVASASNKVKVLVHVLVFVVAIYSIGMLDYKSGLVKKAGAGPWPLLQAVKAIVMFTIILVAYVALIPQYLVKRHEHCMINQFGPSQSSRSAFPDQGMGFISVRELLNHCDVKLHQRPPIRHLLAKVNEEHIDKMTPIPLLVSGPKSLVESVHRSSMEIGSHRFDFHSEKFEL